MVLVVRLDVVRVGMWCVWGVLVVDVAYVCIYVCMCVIYVCMYVCNVCVYVVVGQVIDIMRIESPLVELW